MSAASAWGVNLFGGFFGVDFGAVPAEITLTDVADISCGYSPM